LTTGDAQSRKSSSHTATKEVAAFPSEKTPSMARRRANVGVHCDLKEVSAALSFGGERESKTAAARSHADEQRVFLVASRAGSQRTTIHGMTWVPHTHRPQRRRHAQLGAGKKHHPREMQCMAKQRIRENAEEEQRVMENNVRESLSWDTVAMPKSKRK
jgi:hypothetical protein